MARLFLRRLWLVVALAGVGGAAAWYVTSAAQVVYERTDVFVLRPSAEISDAQIPDAIRGIAQQDSQLVHTVSRVIETDRFLERTFDIALNRPVDPDYSLASAISPGSDVIEVSLRGPDQETLDALAPAFAAEAAGWVDSVYRAYTLDLLEIRAPDGPVSTSPLQTIVLAVLLGALMGLGVVFAEHRARAARAAAAPRASAPTAGPPSHVSVRPSGSGHTSVERTPRFVPSDRSAAPPGEEPAIRPAVRGGGRGTS